MATIKHLAELLAEYIAVFIVWMVVSIFSSYIPLSSHLLFYMQWHHEGWIECDYGTNWKRKNFVSILSFELCN